MTPIRTPQCNHVFGPAEGNEDKVVPLHVQANTDSDGFLQLTSFWRPTEQELTTLLYGGVVTLTIYGTAHPPVKVGAKAL